jgi:hypothetical protein
MESTDGVEKVHRRLIAVFGLYITYARAGVLHEFLVKKYMHMLMSSKVKREKARALRLNSMIESSEMPHQNFALFCMSFSPNRGLEKMYPV